MLRVDQAEMAPHCCAVTGQSEGPFLDTGSLLPGVDGRVYIGRNAAGIIAAEFGYVPGELCERSDDDLRAAEGRIAELEAEVAGLERFRDAIDAIESADFRARRKAGRRGKQGVA